MRVKHPKMILGAVGAAIAIPLLGITISFVNVSANTQQEVSMQENAQKNTIAQEETPPTVAASAAVVVDPQAVLSPLPDPLTPEPSASSSPAPEAVTASAPVASAEPSVKETPRATPSAIPTVKASKSTGAQDVQGVQAPRAVKKTTEIVGSWTPPVLNPGTVLLRAPKLTSGVKASVTVACSPSTGCLINGDQLTFSDGARVTVTYSAKATDTHKAWSKTIRN